MEAILGKITGVAERGGGRFAVSFVPACLLPERAAVPAWLGGAALTIEREVDDPREIGGPGDSIVLTPAESLRWLNPLIITPEVSYGRVPEKLTIRLAWWPVTPPPEYSVRIGRQQLTGTFEQRGDRYVAEIDTNRFTISRLTLPTAITVNFSGLAIHSAVLPADEPFVTRLYLPGREIVRLENCWYRLDIIRRAGGAILAWRERGREIDHFARPNDRIGSPLEVAGHTDWFRTHWTTSELLMKAVLSSVKGWREEGASRLLLAGRVDKSLSTRVECALYDDLPLLAWQRSFELRQVPRRKDDRLQEPVDAVLPFGLGTRGAWAAERQGDTGSRVLCAYGDHLVSLRDVLIDRREGSCGWRVEYGWALAEHPGRRACTLYLFPPLPAPVMNIGTGTGHMTMEPEWPMHPARAGDVFELPLALVAGECCGAEPAGAWVGCRCAVPGGVRCAVIARLREEEEEKALVRLGNEQREVPLQTLRLPGVGAVAWAVADFPGGSMDDPLEITAAGIPQRRPA
ncbi:MAG: hypothetical protein ACYDCO_07250 [Armatimonadota bacterium]